MIDNVRRLVRDGGDAISAQRPSLATIIAVVGMVGTAAASIWFGGQEAGRLQDQLDQVRQQQRDENALVQQQYSAMDSTLNSLNSTIAGLNVEMKNLATDIERERQDRIDFEQRVLQSRR